MTFLKMHSRVRTLMKTARSTTFINIKFFIYILLLFAVPGQPQELKANKVTSHSIDLEWKAPQTDSQSPPINIKGYEIHYYKVNSANNNNDYDSSQQQDSFADTQIFKRKTNNIRKLKYTLSELDANSLYKIQVFAYNMRGDGQRSNALLVNTLPDVPNKPDHIRHEIRDDLLIVRWQMPFTAVASSSSVVSANSDKSNTVNEFIIHFNNEKHQVDGNTHQILFKKPKWGML
jgi:hypothetical protein